MTLGRISFHSPRMRATAGTSILTPEFRIGVSRSNGLITPAVWPAAFSALSRRSAVFEIADKTICADKTAGSRASLVFKKMLEQL